MPEEHDDEREIPRTERTLRSVGTTLGSWARRVGELVSEVSGQTVPVPEPIREPLEQSRALRLAGRLRDARAFLEHTLQAHPDQPHLVAASRLILLHEFFLEDRRLQAVEVDAAEVGVAVAHLVEAAAFLCSDAPEDALDALRRASRDPSRLPAEDERETRLFLHLLLARAHHARGHGERALRELRKARPRMPEAASLQLRRLLVRMGALALLGENQPREAETWISSFLAGPEAEDDRIGLLLLARARAAAGDRLGAHGLLEQLGAPEQDDAFAVETWIVVGLAVGLPEGQSLMQWAEWFRDRDPDDPSRARLWGLAHLTSVTLNRPPDTVPSTQARVAWLDALLEATNAAPAGARDRHLAELAHASLRLDHVTDAVHQAVLRRMQDAPTAPEELRLLRTRIRLGEEHPDLQADFDEGPPVRFRAGIDLGGPHGPDAASPLRDDALRRAMLVGETSLLTAEYCLLRQRPEQAQDLLVVALTEAPGHLRARALIRELANIHTGNRLEDLLAGATTILAGVPQRVLDVSLVEVQNCLSRVVAARERLARPLTIAIMGEFSSGKSTFVNALLGEPVAPMGVLPTTSTINVFRRGPSGGARIHYRDGSISTLAAEQVNSFLHGIDSEEASRIRHVEIERTGPHMGDAAVVDTPGLNALDSFHEQVARGFLDEADAVVWVFSATRGGAASEAGVLKSLRAGGRTVLGVLNKVDTLEDSEQDELTEYLREQLREVLVEVIPLRGTEALAHRSGQRVLDRDPFEPVETALERHFLDQARELKRSVTLRRLVDALEDAREVVDDAVGELEERAERMSMLDSSSELDVRVALRHFAEELHKAVLGLDDTLNREAMGLGMLRMGRGLARENIDEQDWSYLEDLLRDGILAAVGRASAAAASRPGGEHLVSVLETDYTSWAQGYVEGRIGQGLVRETIIERGRAASQGEAAVRSEFRAAFEPVAKALHDRALKLAPMIERRRVREAMAAASSPRAEAMRLRTVVRSGIETLLDTAKEISAGTEAVPRHPNHWTEKENP